MPNTVMMFNFPCSRIKKIIGKGKPKLRYKSKLKILFVHKSLGLLLACFNGLFKFIWLCSSTGAGYVHKRDNELTECNLEFLGKCSFATLEKKI